MALVDRFRKKSIQAQVMPAIYDAPYGQFYGSMGFAGYNNFANTIQRQEAMSVPAIAQCRNLIAGTIASIPLEMFDVATGAEVQDAPPWVRQLDKRAPRSVTIAWLVDSLMMYGVGYLRVTDVYTEDGRPSRFEWVQNDRVSTKLNALSTEVDYYMVNGERVPDSGVGSLVTFQHLDQGLLLRGARTIKQAVNLENAASIASGTPMPSGFLKSSGADLSPEQVSGLLAQWNQSRNSRSTAFLTQSLTYEAVQFSPAEMMYTEAIQNMALQICRLCNVDASYLSAQTQRSDTYSNILDKRKEFVAHTLQPYITAIETRLSLDDICSRGRVIKFAVDETFLRANPLDRLAVTEKMLQLQLISLDQAKMMEDLTPEGNIFNETND